MRPPPSIAEAARKRAAELEKQIQHSLKMFNEGRPGDAETDQSRREQVFQARGNVSLNEARNRIKATNAGAERIFGKTVDFVDVAFFERGRRGANAVGRIIMQDGSAVGTGFLISPQLIITNNHVIASAGAAARMMIEFDYERGLDGAPLQSTKFRLDPDACFLTNDQDDLDYTIVAVGARVSGQKRLSQFGCIPLSNARNKHQLGDFVNIIQHPDGRYKEAVLRENQLVARGKTTLHYVADTEPGASGSPVLNVQFALVALHHWGSPHKEVVGEDGKPLSKLMNEGIRASSIHSDITTLRNTLPAAKRRLIEEALEMALHQERISAPEVSSNGADNDYGSGAHPPAGQAVEVKNGVATWRIPLSLSIRVGDGLATTAAVQPTAEPDQTQAGSSSGGSEARLEIDPDYDARGGYDPAFLVDAAVPLPKLSADQKRIAARNRQAGGADNPFELKYHHFSIVMNAARRLAFYSAVNIDGQTAKDYNRQSGDISDPFEEEGGAEASETWFLDPRIGDDEQTPRDFYSGQTTFDASGNPIEDRRRRQHLMRMFQRGHLTRRQDPLWGDDEERIAYANADTFHVTNCAPQVGFFNMGVAKARFNESRAVKADAESGAKKSAHPGGEMHWRALEDYVLKNARAARARLSVFTGPVFDNENDFDWDRGRDDMQGFKAPREFWKLILRIENEELSAVALIADQTPLIDYLPEAIKAGETGVEAFPYEKVAQYHVSVSELEQRTGLDFGEAVRRADTFASRGRGAAARRRRIGNVEDEAASLIGGSTRAAGRGAARPARKSAASKAAAKKAGKRGARKRSAARKGPVKRRGRSPKS